MLHSNKDSWKNSHFCNTEEKWWHIWSHAEFMKTDFFFFLQRVETYYYLVSLSYNKCYRCTTGELWKSEKKARKGSVSKNRSLGSFLMFSPEISGGQFIFYIVSACCELSLKYLLLTCGISPWCSFSMEKSCPSVLRQLGIRIWFLLEILG